MPKVRHGGHGAGARDDDQGMRGFRADTVESQSRLYKGPTPTLYSCSSCFCILRSRPIRQSYSVYCTHSHMPLF
ncbi:hypothetical protein B0O99DRAFT_646843 [Bisporella sp. PMI_857]|nr:hypothetical protein B0O99DRAFT_646843 [Bisporella sp. PMI_857]